jgi:hypothetical protein
MKEKSPVIIIKDKVALDDLILVSSDTEEQIGDAVAHYVKKCLLSKYGLTEDDVDLIESFVNVEIVVTTTVPWPFSGMPEKKGGKE